MTNTILQFSRLAKIDLGGTKGKTLTKAVEDIHTEFREAVDILLKVKYDIMNIDVKEFDDDFYEFRSKIKELERRLASIITQGFDDMDTIYGRFKLLESFEGLLTRPIIQDELEKKHIVLLESYKTDLKTVQSIFLEGKTLVDNLDPNAPIFNNMPPIAGALTWCRGLQERIKEPIEKLSSLGQVIIEREEYKDVQKLYASITKSINEYEQSKILSWEKEVEASSQEKLKQSLLTKNEQGLLKVNFDPALVRLLREVKYFTLLGLSVPDNAAEIFNKDHIYRSQICSLELIVNNYNNIITCLHPVEEPLIKDRIEKMDVILKPGIDELKWKSPNIDEFIRSAKAIVDENFEIVTIMKESISKIRKCLDDINKPVLERKKPMDPNEYDFVHKAVFQNRKDGIKEKSNQISKLLKDVHEKIKIEKKPPSWKAYTDYVNEIVLEGISKAIFTALAHLNDQINPTFIKRNELQPIFEIKLELGENQVNFEPIIEENPHLNSVRNAAKGWINDFYSIAMFITRLDKPEASDFLQEIRDCFELKEVLSQIYFNLDFLETEANTFKDKFKTYDYLWKNDPQRSFQEFLQENDKDDKGDANAGEEEEAGVSDKDNPLLKGARNRIPNLDYFDEKITSLKAIQEEIKKIETPKEILWLRVNLQPLKVSLDNKVTRWIKVYTDFLVHQVKTTLKNLKEFIRKTNDGIKINPADPENQKNKEVLMSVMKVISDVREVEPKAEGIVKRIKEMVLKLKKHYIQMQEKGEEDTLQSIDNTFAFFNETNQKVFKIKAEILPLQVEETTNIKKRLDEFSQKVIDFRAEFLKNMPFNYDDSYDLPKIDRSYVVINEYYAKLMKIEAERNEYNNLEKLFELEKTNYKQLRECNSDLKFLKVMWDAVAFVNYQYNDWKFKQWRQIKADFLLEQNKLLAQQLKNLPKEIKLFKGYNVVVDKVKNMGVVLPLISSLHSEFMEKRHWKQLMDLTGKQFDQTSPAFSFENVLDLQLHRFENQVNEIVDVAQKEAKIEKKLKNIDSAWTKQMFEFEDFQDTKIFKPLDNMLELLDQNSLDLMGMKSQGKYVEFFFNTVEEWRDKLGKVDSVVNEWLKVQKNWRVLVNIFLYSEDIKSQLSETTKLFESVDKEFRDMMTDVSANPSVIDACTAERLGTLQLMTANIKKCEKDLNEYLEQKKKAFPRFYFLSNQSLLTILSNGNNPPKVCEFLGDCFDGLKTLVFEPAPAGNIPKVGIGMLSKDDERINFSTPFVCEGVVETWLSNLEFKMRSVLYEVLEHAKTTSELWDQGGEPREEWVKEYCAQIALLTTQIVWTEDVSRAFEDLTGGSESAMKDAYRTIEIRIENLIKKVRGKLEYLERLKIINIITIDVHSRDVVDKFNLMRVSEAESFAWLSQLKFYWENKEQDMAARQRLRFPWEESKTKNKCIIKIVDWFRFYSYEYVGNSLRLVITPLTDRCYITLTQALNLTMGGAPAGPAGTGKTETTKDLGRGVGLPVVVFNCSDQMTKDSLAQVFMGLAQSGAWGCFDEFNRISIEVLSVVSSQVKCVLDALKEKKPKFQFMEEGEINLQDTVGFFITMNPGYAGRTELPENLKALFRSCAMVVPNLVLICENMLMSEGFSKARELSRKFVTLYELSKELLSKQRHYDWGLRAVKSVLRQAGQLKRDDPLIPENPLLMRALRDFNLPKIVTDDKMIFTGLIQDLFPKDECDPKTNPDFKKIVVETVKKDMGLVAEELFVLKVIQLSEILEVRHCCFVIGPPGSGKTTVWKTLAKTFINKGEENEYDTLNPKAVTSDELFGCYSKSKEWKNGVLSMIMKNQNKNEDKYRQHQKHKWSILDGDIDPEWIESLNTVMDDNKVLTLVSNDRIPLTPAMRLLFEVSNLKNATPATVSRGGVLFINEADIGWMPYMNSWLERSQYAIKFKGKEELDISKRPPVIDDICKSVFYRCFQTYIEQNQEVHRIKHIAPVVDIMMVMTICTILDALLKEHLETIQKLKEDDQKTAYEALFVYAGMWAIGGSIGGGQDDEKDQKEFNSIWRASSKVKFPEGGLAFDYFFDPAKNTWISWSNRVPTYVPNEDLVFNKIYVSTLHTTRLRYLVDVHVEQFKPVMFVGSAGTGKTAVIKDYLASTKAEKVTHRTMNFNSFTDSKALQKNIETIIEKKSGKTYGSATNKVLVYFIDDLNMPYVDKYGTQSPIALLRQILDYGSIFNREQLEEKKYLQDLLFMAALNPKAGSFTVDLRLQRHFSMFTMYTPSQDTIKTIYGSILGGYLSTFEEKIHKLSDKAIDATIYLFNKILRDTRFSPSAIKFHYQFNLRELAKVTEGMMMSTPNGYNRTPQLITRLWIHECKRVFEDRMVFDEDIKVFRDYLKESLIKNFGEECVEFINDESNIFTTFISIHHGQEPAYLPIKDQQELKKSLEEKLDEYNETKAQMNLVLFLQAMEHVIRIIRILGLPGGNCLLVGVGGSGKQSLSKLATFILGYEVDSLVVNQNFGVNDLKNFLQEVYKKISKPGANPRVFMITDSQIKDEAFLIYINDMLSSGWISDLFPKDESDALIQNLRNEAKANGVMDTLETLTTYFLDKMKRNLHIILCFSPVGENFRVKSRKFPGLISSTSIDWFHKWPKNALIDVANRFISEVELPSKELLSAIALNMAEVHTSIDEANIRFLKVERRYNYTTPKSFLELISFYKKVLSEKRDNINHLISNYERGLKILAETKNKVEYLEQDLKVKMVEVQKRRQETDLLIKKVGDESAIAEGEQAKANEEEEKTNVATEAANKLKMETEKALEEALPALKKAEAAVACLDKKIITEMKSLASPPQMVIIVAKATMVLLGEKVNLNDADDKIWKKAQIFMQNPIKFIEMIKQFKAESIEETVLENTNKVIAEHSDEFTSENMLQKSRAASYLCTYILNVIVFNTIYKKVKPLVEAKDRATDELAEKQKILAGVKEVVRQINEKVSALKRQLEEAEKEKQRVENDANLCQAKLHAAEKLVIGLAGENKRWGENVVILKENTLSIIGDVLLASAFVSYIGAFTSKFRLELWEKKWLPDIKDKKIPITEGITPLKILTTEARMAQWKNQGLPADFMSLENAAIITSCARWPLLIDPQLQGSVWIRGYCGENLQVISMSQNKWLQMLITAIQMGKFVLIEGVQEEIDATLDPLLSRSIIKKGNNYLLELGGDPIDYDPKFKLFLMTKIYNPHFRPEIHAQCSLVNFIVTESGLEEQLLAFVVNREKNDLELKKQELVKTQNEFKMQLDKLEESLLNTLSLADPATILENQELIENLDNTKKTAIEINQKTQLAKVTEAEINKSREIYRPVASEGAMLYFLIISLNIIDHMYQYSLESFYTFYQIAMERTMTQDETRVEELRKMIRVTIYQWVSRGLFERHKLIFLTLITFRLMQKKVIDIAYEPAQMDFLIKCIGKPGVENPLDWLPITAWDAVQGLINLEEFKLFAQNMEKDAPIRFKDWYNELAPETQKLPLDWKKLDQMPFQKLLVLRCLRPDRITTALTSFIRIALPNGDAFVEMDSKLSFSEILSSSVEDSDVTTPIFFILSPGSDPVKEVEKLAKLNKLETNKTFFYLALGQGQDEISERRIKDGYKEGHWVMLQNIHLMPKWLIELEKILDSFSSESGGGSTKFRLFLSAEPSTGVPIGILDRSIKLTNEPPAGLKDNMKRAWKYFAPGEIEDKDPKVKSILFALCFFHSTVIERRRFGPKGWNMSYPFNIGDLRDSYYVLNKYIEQNQGGKVPFEDLIYIFGEIMYGGHIVDDWDRILCRAYLDQIMNENLFDELELFPFIEGKNLSFRVPSPSTYDKYLEHIETSLTQETPLAYGLHPNAEIGFRTFQCSNLFNTLIEVQPRDQATEGDTAGLKTKNEIAAELIVNLFENKSLKGCVFNLDDIKTRIDADNKGPFQNVFLQEIEYMNNLLFEIIKSLEEIDQGFKGLLTISEKMESIIDAISLNRVPVQWTLLAYPSKRGLQNWLENLFKRIDQLNLFRDDPLNIPKVVMISKLFNPQSFLTAIKQIVGRKYGQELNQLYIATEITKKTVEEIEAAGKDGAYVFGFILEGARWDYQIGQLDESKPKEMFFVMPVVYCKAQPIPKEGKEDKSTYLCPCYKTEDRGNTYVFTAQLKTRHIPRKWILAGVAMLMDVEGVPEEFKKK